MEILMRVVRLFMFEIIFLKVFFEPTSCLQSFSESPRNTSLKQGEDVVLKCMVKGQKGLYYFIQLTNFIIKNSFFFR